MLKILKVLYGSRFLIFRGCIQFDVVVAERVIHIKKSLLKDPPKVSIEFP